MVDIWNWNSFLIDFNFLKTLKCKNGKITHSSIFVSFIITSTCECIFLDEIDYQLTTE